MSPETQLTFDTVLCWSETVTIVNLLFSNNVIEFMTNYEAYFINIDILCHWSKLRYLILRRRCVFLPIYILLGEFNIKFDVNSVIPEVKIKSSIDAVSTKNVY